ncbi:MAG: DUF2142 domain-containing protein [Hespellia sp.]|nr:DUF2142 domain-containing protein [Hespellia sp.]
MEKIKKNREVIFIFALFVFYFLWAVVQPFDAPPDEKMRYLIPQYIYNHGSLPVGYDPEIMDAAWGSSYGYTPILSYIISAVFMKIVSIFTTHPFVLLMAARMVSVLCGVGTGIFAIKISKKLWKNPSSQYLFVTLVTLLPQAIFVTSYVNNDAFAILTTAWIVYIWICGLETGWNYRLCAVFGFAMAMALMSYYNTYGFLVCSFFFFIITGLWYRKDSIPYKDRISDVFWKGMLILLVVAIFAGWWYMRNYILYDGDIIGMSTSNKYAELYAINQLKPSFSNASYEKGESVLQMLIQDGWILSTCKSFIGKFGDMSIGLMVWMYACYCLIFFAGAGGVLLSLKKIFTRRNILQWTFIPAILFPIEISMYYSYYSDYQPQGRYILPLLIPFMYFVTEGISEMTQRFCQNHDKLAARAAYAVTALVVAIGILSYVLVLVPAYT